MGNALLGDDSERLWERFCLSPGRPPPQAGCLVSGVSSHMDAFVGHGGPYSALEFLAEEDPDLWNILSLFALMGRNPRLEVRLFHGEDDRLVPADDALQFHKALTDAGYDARLTPVDPDHAIPWSGSAREALIQAISEAVKP
jgi:fermentation-respiration switch protein FrsA (DUF1100 family)